MLGLFWLSTSERWRTLTEIHETDSCPGFSLHSCVILGVPFTFIKFCYLFNRLQYLRSLLTDIKRSLSHIAEWEKLHAEQWILSKAWKGIQKGLERNIPIDNSVFSLGWEPEWWGMCWAQCKAIKDSL